MSFDRFKKYTPIKESAPSNPYAKKAAAPKVENPIDLSDLGDFEELSNFDKEKALLSNSIIEGNNKYLFAALMALRREMKEVKEDLTSLYLMLEEPDCIDDLTKEEIGDKYLKFKMDARNIINRKEK